MNRRAFLGSGASAIFAPFTLGGEARAQQQTTAAKFPNPGSDGWISIFNGRNLEGWYTYFQKSGKNNDPLGMVRVDNGMIHILGNHVPDGAAETGFLSTTAEYSNYRFRGEYRWGIARHKPRSEWKRDNGLLIHVVGEDRVFPMCMEFQVQETDTGDIIPIGGIRHMSPQIGAGLPPWPNMPASAVPAGGPGQPRGNKRLSDLEDREGWNLAEYICRGPHCAFLVNGRIVNTMFQMTRPDPPVFPARGAAPPAGAAAPPPAVEPNFVALERGRIGIEVEYAEIWWRNLAIRPITDAD